MARDAAAHVLRQGAQQVVAVAELLGMPRHLVERSRREAGWQVGWLAPSQVYATRTMLRNESDFFFDLDQDFGL